MLNINSVFLVALGALGALGALTTFSTFTAESFTLLHQGDYFYFFMHLLLHLAGTLLCFSLGWLLLKHLLPL